MSFFIKMCAGWSPSVQLRPVDQILIWLSVSRWVKWFFWWLGSESRGVADRDEGTMQLPGSVIKNAFVANMGG